MCVYFSLAYSVFQFTVVAGLPLSHSVFSPCGIPECEIFSRILAWELFQQREACLLQSVAVSRLNAAFCRMWGRKENQAVLHWPVLAQLCSLVIVCTGGRSAVCGHALLRRAPGPEAPSAGQWEGQRGTLATPVPAAPQASSPAPHGR